MSVLNKYGRVLVISPGQAGDEIRGLLSQVFSAAVECQSATEGRRKAGSESFDAVIVNTPLADEFGVQTAIDLAGKDPDVQVILMVKAEIYEKVTYKVGNLGIFVMTKPVKRQSMLEAARMALAASVRVKLLKTENARLKRKLDELSVTSRAKCLLIEKRGFTEEEAHHYLEKTAMDQSLTKKEVADKIIKEYAT